MNSCSINFDQDIYYNHRGINVFFPSHSLEKSTEDNETQEILISLMAIQLYLLVKIMISKII